MLQNARSLQVLLCTLFLLTTGILQPAQAQSDELTRPVIMEYADWAFIQPERRDSLLHFDVNVLSNLYLSLFRYDPQTRALEPQLAESYEVSTDGLTYTIRIRQDVYWVRFSSGEVIQERLVTAEDVVRGLNRRCSGLDFLIVFFEAIRGCTGAGNASGITAIDDRTVQISLSQPAAYLPYALTGRYAVPVPEEQRDFWSVQLDGLLSSGAYVLQSEKIGEPTPTYTFVQNPWFPADLRENGNVEQVVLRIYDVQIAENFDQIISEFQTGRAALFLGYAEQVSGRSIRMQPDNVSVIVLNPDKPPFDDVRVRRAFSAAINREALFNDGYSIPAARFGAPAVFGEESSAALLGFDPDYAAEQLAAAGYPDCEGLPAIQIKTDEFAVPFWDLMIGAFVETLGCSADVFNVEVLSFNEMYEMVYGDSLARRLPGQFPSPTNAQRPNMWLTNSQTTIPEGFGQLGWLLDCDLSTWGVPCTAAQPLFAQATAELDAAERSLIWSEIETVLFGRDGEFPVLPLYFYGGAELFAADWVDGDPTSYYRDVADWSALTINNEARIEVIGASTSLPEPEAELNVGEVVDSSITTGDSVRVFTIPPSGEETISITATAVDDSGLDLQMTIYAEDGSVLRLVDDGGFENLNPVLRGLPGTETLTVAVYAFDDRSTGDFSLRVSGAGLTGAIQAEGSANVRSGPGTGFGTVTALATGTEVEIAGRNADSSWLLIRFPDGEGWVASFLVVTDGELESLPVVP